MEGTCQMSPWLYVNEGHWKWELEVLLSRNYHRLGGVFLTFPEAGKFKIKAPAAQVLNSRELESARGKVVTNEVGMYSGMRPECQVQFFFFSLGNCKSVEALKQPGNVISLLG